MDRTQVEFGEEIMPQKMWETQCVCDSVAGRTQLELDSEKNAPEAAFAPSPLHANRSQSTYVTRQQFQDAEFNYHNKQKERMLEDLSRSESKFDWSLRGAADHRAVLERLSPWFRDSPLVELLSTFELAKSPRTCHMGISLLETSKPWVGLSLGRHRE